MGRKKTFYYSCIFDDIMPNLLFVIRLDVVQVISMSYVNLYTTALYDRAMKKRIRLYYLDSSITRV